MLLQPSPDPSHQASPSASLVRLSGGLGAVPETRLAGVHAGFKRRKRDLALIAWSRPRAVAACITTNDVKAAPLEVSAQHLRTTGNRARALVCNAGCANACTGVRGEEDARLTAHITAALLGCAAEEVLVASTGVIGTPLPMDVMRRGLRHAGAQLALGTAAACEAAEAIMTTDRQPKLAAYGYGFEQSRFVIGGIAKGSGMIAPHLATMLCFIGTDAPVGDLALQRRLGAACEETFNMISVDGDMSTNDAVYLVAEPHADPNYEPEGFSDALTAVCRDLAVAMARDGEGATKLLQMTLSGAASRPQARALARAVVDSSLVKCALFGENPNWGRIIAAAGAAGAGFPASGWVLDLCGAPWVRDSVELLNFEEAHRRLGASEIAVEIKLALGSESATAWGCDFSGEYVRINAHYRT